MNRINPFVLTAVLVVILALLVLKTASLRADLSTQVQSISALENEAKSVSVLKKSWDKSNLEAKLKTIFDASSISSKSRSFEIKASNLNEPSANDIIGRVFGDTFEVAKFTLDKSPQSVTINLEILK